MSKLKALAIEMPKLAVAYLQYRRAVSKWAYYESEFGDRVKFARSVAQLEFEYGQNPATTAFFDRGLTALKLNGAITRFAREWTGRDVMLDEEYRF